MGPAVTDDDRDRRYRRPRTPPPDSDSPVDVSGELSIPDPRDEFGDVTPPPHNIDQLLRWLSQKLPNKLNALNEGMRHVKRVPDDHEKRMRALETDMVDLRGASGDNGKLGALTARFDHMEEKVEKHIATTTTTIEDLKAFRWKVMGAVALGGIFTGLITAVLTVLITRNM